MTDEHTKEPWVQAVLMVQAADKTGIGHFGGYRYHGATPQPEEGVANARRAVAAVNFCQGIPTEQLKQAIEAGGLEALVGACKMGREIINAFYVMEGLDEDARKVNLRKIDDALMPFKQPE